MSLNLHQTKIIYNYSETKCFVDEVCKSADSEKNALGFYPRKVFEEFAQKENLLVIVSTLNSSCNYLGHLIYSTNYPYANILQMYICTDFRRNGLASILLQYLKNELEKSNFLFIKARVAEDLVESRKFWDKQGFNVQKIVDGGKSKNRKIHVLCHELKSPQLFPTSGISNTNPLGLLAPIKKTPLYLLDLNVLFDLGPRRFRHNEAVSLV